MGQPVIPFPKVQIKHTTLNTNTETSPMPTLDHYYESLGDIRDSLKQLAKDHKVSLKEAMIDLTYIAVGDEIVTQLIDGESES